MKKPIVIIAPAPSNSGGIARWSSIYTSYLRENNIPFNLLSTDPSWAKTRRGGLITRVLSSAIPTLRILGDLKKLLKKQSVGFVHIATSGSLSLIRDKYVIRLCKKYGVPVIYHYHFGTFQSIKEKGGNEYKLLESNSNKCDRVICIDRTTFAAAKDSIPIIECIPNPVDLIDRQGSETKKKNIILFAGHIRDNKGIKELLRAWSTIRDKYPDWKLILSGELFDEYKKLEIVNQLSSSNTIFTGKIPFDDLQASMMEASIFILPSHFEGCPNVILEAMSNRCAIIGTAVGAIPEMIGDCGILIPVNDEKAITNAIETYINGKEKRLLDGKTAHDKISSTYSSKIICAKYIIHE